MLPARRGRRRLLVGAFAAAAAAALVVSALQHAPAVTSGEMVSPKDVGLTLFGPYVLAVEIASMLLLSGLVGAYHLGRRFIVRRER